MQKNVACAARIFTSVAEGERSSMITQLIRNITCLSSHVSVE